MRIIWIGRTLSLHITTAVGQLLMICEFCMARLSHRPSVSPNVRMAQLLLVKLTRALRFADVWPDQKASNLTSNQLFAACHQAYQSTLLFAHVSVAQLLLVKLTRALRFADVWPDRKASNLTSKQLFALLIKLTKALFCSPMLVCGKYGPKALRTRWEL